MKTLNYAQLMIIPSSTKETKQFIDDLSREVSDRREKLATARDMVKKVPDINTVKRDIWFDALVYYIEGQERAIRRLQLILKRLCKHIPHDGRPVNYEIEQHGRIPMWKASFQIDGQDVTYLLGTVVDAP